jgi:hypothetical protein
MQGLTAMATGSLQRGSGLYRPDLGPAGSSWDWCASMGALRVLWAWPELIRTGVPAAASGRLLPLVVEAVPSRTAAVLLASIHATLHRFHADLVSVTLVRQRWRLRDRSGACSWMSSLVVSRL